MNIPALIRHSPEPAYEPVDDSGRETSAVPAHYLADLVLIWGSARVAQATGYHQSTIATAVRTGECRLSLEILAKFLFLEEKAVKTTPPELCVCSVPIEKLESFRIVAEAMGVKVSALHI